ncbi:transcription factor [Colletotrichum truncatum]|uniref:Transcription factor n=1 Tax=Colletotrichum truncatum TaxID=5467 RepID=A0ACC3YXB8_COLTU
MASHPQGDSLDDVEHNPYASDNRWRHQESSAFARHAAQAHAIPRDPQERGSTTDLASFLNRDRVEPENPNAPPNFKPIMIAAGEAAGEEQPRSNTAHSYEQPNAPDGREITCGPLLNYRRMDAERWYGSVLIVAKGGGKTQSFAPTLILRPAGSADRHNTAPQVEAVNGTNGAVNGAVNGESSNGANGSNGADENGTQIQGQCLYSDPRNTFWAFDLSLPLSQAEAKWEYLIPDMRFSSIRPGRYHFFVPSINESMRIMFHSCNGFSVGTDEDAWSGPALWNDVNRHHKERPFHVMIGGGDQIYNDGIRVDGPLREWTEISNPKKRRHFPFPEKLRQACDDYYLKNYIRWYSTEPFATANGQIPMLNIWDDHDIIDGFGSYVDDFMRCDVFRGIGGTAHKYYMLFQHHLPPPRSTYTSDFTPATEGQGLDPNQLMDTYVAPPKSDPGYIVGTEPGPYVAEHSHNMYARLGARIGFLGIDARTERTRHQINYPETYDLIFSRLRHELKSCVEAGRPLKHLILLLGIPIAYPRLTWLENVFRSPIMGPVKFLNRRFGFAGGVFNHFDGSIDLLDDLDDHYTARTHKKERGALVERLQAISSEFSVRITILGGDVHLAALGRFYSHPRLKIATENDHRYMANVISSAITNKPPPAAIANLLARRNKIHHLNHDTDETLLKFFDKDPGGSSKTSSSNHVTMPSRNFAILTENSPNNGLAAPSINGDARSTISGKGGHDYLHHGEIESGSKHRAATKQHGTGNDGSLDICIQVEVDQHNPDGITEGYGLTVPQLKYNQAPEPVEPFPPQQRPNGDGE